MLDKYAFLPTLNESLILTELEIFIRPLISTVSSVIVIDSDKDPALSD